MVQLSGFCIDTTEVTNAQYAAFLAARTSNGQHNIGGQPLACSGNTTFTPGMPSDTSRWPQPADKSNYPVTSVDWCDARAFCSWSGKSLCGARAGGPVAYTADFVDPTKDQWTYACMGGDGTTRKEYPYGSNYIASACNAGSVANGGEAGLPVAVKSMSNCVGGFAGLYDMSGNVREWEDACNTAGTQDGGSFPQNDQCRVRGGSANFQSAEVACASEQSTSQTRGLQRDGLGFRCCGALAP